MANGRAQREAAEIQILRGLYDEFAADKLLSLRHPLPVFFFSFTSNITCRAVADANAKTPTSNPRPDRFALADTSQPGKHAPKAACAKRFTRLPMKSK